MEVYTPGFIKVRNLLKPIILNLLGKYLELDTLDIEKEIKKMKEEDKEKFALIDFAYLSEQIHAVLVDMVRRCVVEQTRGGYKLTSYGLKLSWDI